MSSTRNRVCAVLSVTNCICNDQRVLKMAETLSSIDCDITLIGRKNQHCCNNSTIRYKTRRFRMIFKKGFLFYAFFNLRLFLHLLLHNYNLLIANDLDTLLPNFLVSRLKRRTLVYDSHEYYTGVAELQARPFVRKIWKLIEKNTFPNIRNIITVSDSIALQYESEYGKRPVTVRNCAYCSDNIIPYSREETGLNPDDLVLILQGTGINKDRGSEELIEAISLIENTSLLIVGSGDIVESLKIKVLQSGLSYKVKFFPCVGWTEMMRFTKTANIGVSLDKDTCTNHRFSLPNKLFDYVSAGIPVIASDLPEIKRLIDEYGFGVTITNVSPGSISKSILDLQRNTSKLAELKRKSIEASKQLNWEIESKKVTEFYKTILDNRC